MYDVITVGSSTVDVFARSKSSGLIKIIDSSGEKNLLAYPTGSKILIEELNFTTGGGATNTAASFARLGLKVGCISKMGTGPNSARVITHLKREKVDDTLLVRKKGARTGYSIILDSIEHDRTILAFKGSNNDLKYNEIKLNKLKTKWFYFSTMLGEGFKTLVKLAKFAEKNKIKIAFNASEYLVKKGTNFLKDILKRTHIFVLNKDEAKILVLGDDINNMLVKIHELGPKIVVITDGKKEVIVFDGEFIYSFNPTSAKPIETTGAGDAFASSFLTGIIEKNDIEFALKLASANSESVIQHHGAKNKLLTMKEALKIMKRDNIKVKKKKI
jgi:ribokinase